MIKKGLTLINVLTGLFIIFLIAILVAWFVMPRESAQKENNEGDEIANANQGAINDALLNFPSQLRPIDETDHISGDINAPVKIIVYSDFECPFCAKFSETIKKIKEEFGDKIVIAFRHFPLTQIHYNSLNSAIASECADEQGKFWEMHDALFTDNTLGAIGVEEFKKDAYDIGLDVNKFNECLATGKYKDKVMAQIAEGKSAGVTGTPASFINGEIIIGAYPLEDFVDSAGVQREGIRSIILRNIK